MKKALLIPLLVLTPLSLSSCSLILKWYRGATKIATTNDPFKIETSENEELKVTLKTKTGLSISDDHHISSSRKLNPCSYSPDDYRFIYNTIYEGEEIRSFYNTYDDLSDENNNFYGYIFEIKFEVESPIDVQIDIDVLFFLPLGFFSF